MDMNLCESHSTMGLVDKENYLLVCRSRIRFLFYRLLSDLKRNLFNIMMLIRLYILLIFCILHFHNTKK